MGERAEVGRGRIAWHVCAVSSSLRRRFSSWSCASAAAVYHKHTSRVTMPQIGSFWVPIFDWSSVDQNNIPVP